jgi:hypothetical protein
MGETVARCRPSSLMKASIRHPATLSFRLDAWSSRSFIGTAPSLEFFVGDSGIPHFLISLEQRPSIPVKLQKRKSMSSHSDRSAETPSVSASRSNTPQWAGDLERKTKRNWKVIPSFISPSRSLSAGS